MPALDSDVLDFRAASELFTPVRKLKRADLDTLRLVTTRLISLIERGLVREVGTSLQDSRRQYLLASKG